jgi:hypothetical protein
LEGNENNARLSGRVSAFTFKTPINSRIEGILTAKAKKAQRV